MRPTVQASASLQTSDNIEFTNRVAADSRLQKLYLLTHLLAVPLDSPSVATPGAASVFSTERLEARREAGAGLTTHGLFLRLYSRELSGGRPTNELIPDVGLRANTNWQADYRSRPRPARAPLDAPLASGPVGQGGPRVR